ncbi:MAG TPA: hypothetical protein VH394_13725, partial [Thermoanaerobaculia bacterium]|nr:hypothetical protein [Thermoanaerobaculia bacterium]
KGERDVVRAFLRLARLQRRRTCEIVPLEEIQADFRAVLDHFNIPHIPPALIIFAHPSRELNGFLANPSTKLEDNVLLLRWWEGYGHGRVSSYGLVVAHVCKGAHVFRRPKWGPIFPNWVSYEGDILSYLASDLGTKRWKSVLDEMATEVPKSKDARDAKKRIEKIYRKAILALGDSFSNREGDAANLIYFQQCLESIACNEV